MKGELTKRQLEVLQAMADGGVAKVARGRLGIGHNTFWEHMKAAGERLGTQGSVQAVAEGFRRGLLR